MQAGDGQLGSCLTDATREAAPGKPLVKLPLCCRPNGLRNSHRGPLTRWNHLDLRTGKVAVKFWTNKSDCQACGGASAAQAKKRAGTAAMRLWIFAPWPVMQ